MVKMEDRKKRKERKAVLKNKISNDKLTSKFFEVPQRKFHKY